MKKRLSAPATGGLPSGVEQIEAELSTSEAVRKPAKKKSTRRNTPKKNTAKKPKGKKRSDD